MSRHTERLRNLRLMHNHYAGLTAKARAEGKLLSYRERDESCLRYAIEQLSWRTITAKSPTIGKVVHVYVRQIGAITARRTLDGFVCACGCERPIPTPTAFQHRSSRPTHDQPDEPFDG